MGKRREICSFGCASILPVKARDKQTKRHRERASEQVPQDDGNNHERQEHRRRDQRQEERSQHAKQEKQRGYRETYNHVQQVLCLHLQGPSVEVFCFGESGGCAAVSSSSSGSRGSSQGARKAF